MAVILLGLHFFTKDPDFVNDTVDIFQFPELFLSAWSKASMVTRIWDTALDANTMNSYANTAALMKQHHIPLIIGWGGTANMLKQWIVVITVLLGPQDRHLEVFELATFLTAADEVNSRL